MKLLIVGLGSMGKRRARLIKGVDASIMLSGVDMTESRRAQAAELGITAYESIETAVAAQKFDAAFVCTAPVTHAKIIDALLDANLPVFTELNLVADGYD
ncbi:MAG: Gfo/Idh/MocA family oxidoreductase, partial [Ruthenibacterium sp.]